jgi:hypothetical protein
MLVCDIDISALLVVRGCRVVEVLAVLAGWGCATTDSTCTRGHAAIMMEESENLSLHLIDPSIFLTQHERAKPV